MTTKLRIYVVTNTKDLERVPRLVRAGRMSQAVTHVARSEWSAKVASQNDMERLLKNGVEDAELASSPSASEMN